MNIDKPFLHHAVSALMRLRGVPIVHAADRCGIQRPNLSSWLKGRPNTLSEKRQATLLAFLGVEGMKLKLGLIHHWVLGEDIEDLVEVLRFFLSGDERERLEIFSGGTGVAKRSVLRVCGDEIPLIVAVSRFDALRPLKPLMPEKIGFGRRVVVQPEEIAADDYPELVEKLDRLIQKSHAIPAKHINAIERKAESTPSNDDLAAVLRQARNAGWSYFDLVRLIEWGVGNDWRNANLKHE